MVLAERAALFCRRPLHSAGDTQVDGKIFSIEHLVEHPPDQWLEQNLKNGAKLGYDPWLHTSEQAESRGRLARQRAPNWWRSTAILSTRSWRNAGVTGSRGDPARYKIRRRAGHRQAKTHPRRTAKLRADRIARFNPTERGLGIQHSRRRCRTYSPGTCLTRLIPREGRPALYIDAAKLNNNVRQALEEFSDVHPQDYLAHDLGKFKDKTLGPTRPARRTRSPASSRTRGRQAATRRRSDCAVEGGEEPRRDCRQPRRPQARWRGGGSLPGLVRQGSTLRQTG